MPQTAVLEGQISKSDHVPQSPPLPARTEPAEQAMFTLLPAVSSRCLLLSSPCTCPCLFSGPSPENTSIYLSTPYLMFSLTCCLLLRFELNASYQTELSITHQTVFPLTKAANLGSCLAKDLIHRMNGWVIGFFVICLFCSSLGLVRFKRLRQCSRTIAPSSYDCTIIIKNPESQCCNPMCKILAPDPPPLHCSQHRAV